MYVELATVFNILKTHDGTKNSKKLLVSRAVKLVFYDWGFSGINSLQYFILASAIKYEIIIWINLTYDMD